MLDVSKKVTEVEVNQIAVCFDHNIVTVSISNTLEKTVYFSLEQTKDNANVPKRMMLHSSRRRSSQISFLPFLSTSYHLRD